MAANRLTWARIITTRPALDVPTRILHGASAATVAGSGYIHAQLYSEGYRYIHVVGVLFYVQAAMSFIVAAVLLAAVVVRPPVLVQLAGAGTAVGALGGFVASRTVGVFGFIEHGFQPSPQALLSVLAESATILFTAAAVSWHLVRSRRGAPSALPAQP
jgi:hypothetical protein